jgi:hypothetical protein
VRILSFLVGAIFASVAYADGTFNAPFCASCATAWKYVPLTAAQKNHSQDDTYSSQVVYNIAHGTYTSTPNLTPVGGYCQSNGFTCPHWTVFMSTGSYGLPIWNWTTGMGSKQVTGGWIDFTTGSPSPDGPSSWPAAHPANFWPWPAGAAPNITGDAKLEIVDSSNGLVYDCDGTSAVTSTTFTCYYGRISYLNQGGTTFGTVAIKTPSLAGAIRLSDLQSGVIAHVLGAMSAFNQGPKGSGNFRWPAIYTDGLYSGIGSVQEGSRLYLDSSVDCPNLANATPGEKMICKAAQDYGIIINDTGASNLNFYAGADTAANWQALQSYFGGNNTYYDCSHIPWSQLHLLKTFLDTFSGPPTAVNQSATTAMNTPVSTDVSTGAAGCPCSSAAVSGTPVNGTASVTSGTTVQFTPTTNFTGTGSYNFTLTNSNGTSNVATTTVTVGGGGQPTAQPRLRESRLQSPFASARPCSTAGCDPSRRWSPRGQP